MLIKALIIKVLMHYFKHTTLKNGQLEVMEVNAINLLLMSKNKNAKN